MANSFWNKTKEFFALDDPAKYVDGYDLDPRPLGEDYDRADRSERTDRLDREELVDRGDRASRLDRGESDFRASRPSYEPPRRDAAYSSRSEREIEPAFSRPAAPREPQFEILTFASYQQASELVKVVHEGDVAVFALSGVEKSEATRVLDYARGLADGVRGKLKKLRGTRNFALLPQGVDLDQDQLDALADEL